jgi:chemotaxis protein CheD
MDENAVIARKTVGWQPPSGDVAGGAGSLHNTLPEVYLHPGQNYVAADPVVLKMVLGSCAGVFLFDRTLGIGGAAHFMLPCQLEGPPSARYGNVAIAGLLDRFRALGSRRASIHASVFGGAGMLQALKDLNGPRIGQIGRRNVEIAFEILERESIAIVEKNVLGNQARKVSMVSNTGEIALEFVSNADGNR